MLLAHFLTKAPHDEDGLADLLEPIEQQLEAVRLARQRRRVPVDSEPGVPVDSEPGAPVDSELAL